MALNSLLLPDIAGQYQKGYAFGDSVKKARKAEADQNMLTGLAPQVIAGDPGAYAQAAAIDPQAATAYQSAGDSQLRRLKGAISYLDNIQDPAAKERAYQTEVVPYLSRFAPSGRTPPATFAEASPMMEQARARIAAMEEARLGQAGASGVQSTFVDEAGNRVAIMRDGSTQVLGRNNASIRVLEQEGQLPYGVVTSGGAAGQVVPLGQGMGAQQAPAQPQGWQQTGPAMFVAADGQPIPPEDQAALMRAMQEAQRTGGDVNVPASAPAPAPGALPPRLDYRNGGTVGPVRVPTSAEKAAAEAAARRQVELSTLPAELQMRTDAAAEQAQRTADISAAKDIAKDERQKGTAWAQYQAAMSAVENALANTQTDPITGLLPAVTANQQIAEGAVGAMAPILKQLFRSAGEGTFTDKDQALLMDMLPTRQDHPEARKAKIANINAIVRAKLGQQASQQQAVDSGAGGDGWSIEVIP